MKFTFRGDPIQKYLRGTLLFEVNFTGWGYPYQKGLRGSFGDLVKFTFEDDPCLSLKEVDSQTARSNVYLSNRTEESVL